MKVGVWFILLLAGQFVKYSISNYYFSFFSRNRVSFPPKNSAQISSERKGLKPIFANLFNGLEEEFRYRKSTIEQYRDRLTGKLLRSIEKFRRDQDILRKDANVQLDLYAAKIKELYNETIISLQRQQRSIYDLHESESKQFLRPKRIDESLEEFRKSFNESEFMEGLLSNKWRPNWKRTDTASIQNFSKLDPFSTQIEGLTTNLKKNWIFLLQMSAEGSRNADSLVQRTYEDFIRLQEDLKQSSKLLEKATQEMFPLTLNKDDLRNKTGSMEVHLKKLERDGIAWMTERYTKLDSAVKALQEKLQASESVYDELVGKKKAAVHYSLMNDITLNRVLNLIDLRDPGWQLIRSEGDVQVFRKFMGGDSSGGKYACVKCSATVNASRDAILKLFEDNTRVREYNSFFDSGRDLENVAENTKVVWACSQGIFPFKARDFCTVVHFRQLKDGTVIVLNRATDHPEAPISKDFVRAKIILAANIIQPLPGRPNSCRLTMITQLDPGGFAPPVIVNNVCTIGPISFMKNIEIAARKTPSQAILREKEELAKSGKGMKLDLSKGPG